MSEQDLIRINVGRHSIGILGLQGLIEEMTASHGKKSDDEIRQFMLERLSVLNYIPSSARGEYGDAFLREFRKALGQPVQESAPVVLDIKVLGAGCNQCDSLEQSLMEVLTETAIPATLEHVREMQDIARYGVMGVPALVVNGKVLATGSIPAKKKLRGLIEEAAKKHGIKPSR